MTIKITLKKEVDGQELARIVKNSINFLEGYESEVLDYNKVYVPGSVKIEDETRYLKGFKPTVKNKFLRGLASHFYGGYRIISTSIGLNERCSELSFYVKRGGMFDNSIESLARTPELKQEFESLVEQIYKRLNLI